MHKCSVDNWPFLAHMPGNDCIKKLDEAGINRVWEIPEFLEKEKSCLVSRFYLEYRKRKYFERKQMLSI